MYDTLSSILRIQLILLRILIKKRRRRNTHRAKHHAEICPRFLQHRSALFALPRPSVRLECLCHQHRRPLCVSCHCLRESHLSSWPYSWYRRGAQARCSRQCAWPYGLSHAPPFCDVVVQVSTGTFPTVPFVAHRINVQYTAGPVAALHEQTRAGTNTAAGRLTGRGGSPGGAWPCRAGGRRWCGP